MFDLVWLTIELYLYLSQAAIKHISDLTMVSGSIKIWWLIYLTILLSLGEIYW